MGASPTRGNVHLAPQLETQAPDRTHQSPLLVVLVFGSKLGSTPKKQLVLCPCPRQWSHKPC